MASNYSKLDFKSFKQRLTEGHYRGATGARRGVGKSELSADEKEKALKEIDKHFGVESKPVAAKALKAAAKKGAPAKGGKATKGATKGGKRAPASKKAAGGRGRKAASDSEAG